VYKVEFTTTAATFEFSWTSQRFLFPTYSTWALGASQVNFGEILAKDFYGSRLPFLLHNISVES